MYYRKSTTVTCTLLLALAILCFSSVSRSTAVPDPTEQMRPLVDRIVGILTDPALQGEDKCFERRERVMQIAHEQFDFVEMSKRVLGKQWRQLSPSEKQEFTGLFTTLLEHAYIGKIEDYNHQKVEFKSQRVKKNRAEVKTVIIDQEVTIPVSYIMILKDGQWKVYDIIVEGVSLVRNYMEQFKEILRTEGYSTLLTQLKDKVNELELATKPCPVDLAPKKS